MTTPSVAIVHDFLVGRGGAERVALSMARAFPDAEVHTALYDAERTFAGFADHDIRPLVLDRVRSLRRHHRSTLPFLQPAFSRRVVHADVVICSTSGFAHTVRTTGRKLVYCHTPARWLHDRHRYLQRFGPATRVAARALRSPSLRLDRTAMTGADHVLANSTVIQQQLWDHYDVHADVVHPCSSLHLDGDLDPITGLTPGFVFCPARPLGYKRLDVLVDAAAHLPYLTFLQVGDGPDVARLRAAAPPNMRVMGAVSDATLRWAYRHAAVVALTSAEDFGLVPIEAAAHGLMSIVPKARGFLDHVVDGENGWFYQFGNAEELASTIEEKIGVRSVTPPHDPLQEDRFMNDIRAIVARVAAS